MTNPSDGVVSWSEYYQPDYTLPEIVDHLSNMGHMLGPCQAMPAGSRMLEIGTGTGLVTIYLSQCGYDMTGLDYDPGIIALNERLNKRLGGRASFVVGDMFALPYADGAFDAIFHQGLMEHFDEGPIVASFHEQLRVARRVIFTVPTVHWHGGVRGDERMWTGAYWRKLLAPFRVVSVFGASYPDPLTRALHFFGGRATQHRPKGLFESMAMRRAGQIGFIVEAG